MTTPTRSRPGPAIQVLSDGGGVRSTSLTRHARPLAQVIEDQPARGQPEDPGCDSGWCLT